MKSIKYQYQFSHYAILTGLLAMLMHSSWDTLLLLDILIAVFLAFEISHNLYMIFGTPIIIMGNKLVKKYWCFKKTVLIDEKTEFPYTHLLGLSWAKEILTIKSNKSTVKIIDNLKVKLRELPDLLLSNLQNPEK
jgi:hypothetical protein